MIPHSVYICPLNFENIENKISFCTFSILSAHYENARKVFKHLWGIGGKCLAVFGEYAESIEANMKNTTELGCLRLKIVSE
jgi:hypothetical protein